MRAEEAILDYIKRFYVIDCQPNRDGGFIIVLRDTLESIVKGEQVVDIISSGVRKVVFYWGNIHKYITIDMYHADNYRLASLIKKIFMHRRSLSFYDFLLNEQTRVVIELNQVKDEFPRLYGEEFDSIISGYLSADKDKE